MSKTEAKHTVTPGATITSRLHVGLLLDLPVNQHIAIVETTSLPPELGFPNQVPRVYTVVNPPNNSYPASGAHAHNPGTEQEIMYAVAGLATVHLWDRDGNHVSIQLAPAEKDTKFRAIFVPAGIWHTVRYAPGTAMNVVASTLYDRSYYIENPEDYFTPEGLENYRRTFPE